MPQKQYLIKWGKCGMMSYVYAESPLEAISRLKAEITAINLNRMQLGVLTRAPSFFAPNAMPIMEQLTLKGVL